MSVNLSPVAGAAAQFLDNSGNVLTGGKLYTYLAGTTTPAATYTSSTGVTFHANPIILDAAGRVPSGGEIWLSDNISYKFVLKDANDVLIATWDNLSGINSNFVNYTVQEEVQTATAGQTVFNLTTVTYAPGTNSLSVYVDGVNQYEGSTYSFVETNATTVTFTAGLHVGALVKFTTAVPATGTATNANVVTYDPAGTGAVSTTVEAKLRETVSVKDFGAVGDGIADDTAAIQAAVDSAVTQDVALRIPAGTYKLTAKITKSAATKISLIGDGSQLSILEWAAGATGGGGIDLTYTDVLYACDVQGLSFVTNDNAAGTGLKITGPEAASVTVLGPNVKDLRFTGKDVSTDCWLDNLHFYTCWYITLSQVSIKGQDGTTSFASLSGIKLTSCQVIYASKFTMVHVDVGVLEVASGVASHGEGFQFSEFEIVGCTKGISLFADGVAPGTNIGPGHINSNTIGIEVANQYQTSIHDMLIYRTQFSITPYTGIVLFNANACLVHDNNIHGVLSGTGDMVGIAMTGTTENDYLQIHDNIFRNFVGTSKVGIAVGTGTGLSNIHDNFGDSSLTALFVIDPAAEKTNRFHNNFPVEIQTLEVDSATPSVGNDVNGQWNATNTVATTITNFLNGYTSQIVYIYATNTNTTIENNSNIILSGGVNFVMGAGAVLMIRRDATVWREISRNIP